MHENIPIPTASWKGTTIQSKSLNGLLLTFEHFDICACGSCNKIFVRLFNNKKRGNAETFPQGNLIKTILLTLSHYMSNYNLLAASSSMITVTSSCFCKTLAGKSTVTSPSIMPLIASALSVPKAINNIFLLCMIEPIPIDNA